MKNFLLPLIALMMLAAPVSAIAQESINPPPADSPAYTLPAEGTVLSATDFREQIATSIREAAQEDPDLNRREKRRIDRVMSGRGFFGKWRREAVIDNVAQKMVSEGAVEVTPEGVMAAGGWQQWLEIFKELMPIILQIISILGG